MKRIQTITDHGRAVCDRIIKAATSEFATYGINGARMDRIAADAEINKKMLYSYMGGKDELWLAVLERVYENLRANDASFQPDRDDPRKSMEDFIRINFRFHAQNPDVIAILNEENRHHARTLAKSKKVPVLYNPLVSMLDDILCEGQRKCCFRADVDAINLFISIASLSYFYFSNIYTLSGIFQKDLSAADEVSRREAHVVSCILGYLASSPDD